ncbi:MAG: adenine phosphoribosyltransferase [Proteobacteria bacterium]|nr:adenine phosphoribosyltransferase [Pseudomonadota bacterium]
MKSDRDRIAALIRTIPDFPKKGIMFRDVTTLILDHSGLTRTGEIMCEQARVLRPDKIIGIESRGFIFGTLVAKGLESGLVLARKKGKLPGKTIQHTYDLEYGQDTLEIHVDAIKPGERCLIVDDLLATGGTAEAAACLVEKMGGKVIGCSFVVNLPELGGHKKLAHYPLNWIVDFEGH